MLQGEKIALGPILPLDLPQLMLWGDDPELCRRSETYRPKSFQREADFWLNSANDQNIVFFAIRQDLSLPIIGYVQIHSISATHRSAMLGIMLGNAADRGKGYGGDAMVLAIDYCWRHLNLSRLSLHVHTTNPGAIRLYERLGFETEGLLKKALFLAGEWVDVQMMALCRPDR
jgi:RimJ/RimL family protein N-acetyltransferase